jgi:NhaP-type Na+/H+ or K+/H+ antiporter
LGLGWFDGDVSRTGLRVLADLTLALILFIDAANADLAILKRQFRIPSRMLLFGLPGVIFLGTVIAALLFETLSLSEAAILGTMLAATDAALGKAVITNKAVPVQILEGGYKRSFDLKKGTKTVDANLTISYLLPND